LFDRVRDPQRASLLDMETLVRLGVEDAGELLTLHRAAYVTEGQAQAIWTCRPCGRPCQIWPPSLQLADPAVLALGWRDDTGRLIAAARARVAETAKGIAEIGRLTVVPDRQGQRLGTRLLTAVEAELPPSVTELRLFTGERSVDNLRLYARAGYTKTGRQPTRAGYSLVHISKRRGPSR